VIKHLGKEIPIETDVGSQVGYCQTGLVVPGQAKRNVNSRTVVSLENHSRRTPGPANPAPIPDQSKGNSGLGQEEPGEKEDGSNDIPPAGLSRRTSVDEQQEQRSEEKDGAERCMGSE
jgi:hypothetical protein